MLIAALSACGPAVGDWKGTWKGNAVINTGRAPIVVPGLLTIADGAQFTVTSDPRGTPAQVYSCALNAMSVEGSSATFQVPTTNCALKATPGDGCTYAVTINTASATRNADMLTGSVSGRLTSTCTSGNSIEDFGLELTATRQK